MAEFRRYPLRVEQSKLDGWWFVFVDELRELVAFGPITKTCSAALNAGQETRFARAERPSLTLKLQL
jgi:predicted RNase H-like HicB family nuclease